MNDASKGGSLGRAPHANGWTPGQPERLPPSRLHSSLRQQTFARPSAHRETWRGAVGLIAAGTCMIGCLVAPAAPWAQAAASPPPAPAAPRVADTDERRIADLVEANHILANERVLDGLGHISARSVAHPGHYFMARSMAPTAVTRADIVEFDENGKGVDDRGRAVYAERFIHGEIYRARPDVQAIVHSHAAPVLPFTITGAPFAPAIHMASFMGVDPAPMFDIRDSDGPDNRMLVSNAKNGAALAKALGNRNIVLMRGHGFVVVSGPEGQPVRWAAARSFYAEENAEALAKSMALGKPKFLNRFEVNFVPGVLEPWWDQYAIRAAEATPDKAVLSPPDNRAPASFTLTAPSFADGGAMALINAGALPTKPNCLGKNLSPALAWTNPPAGVRSFAMFMLDPEGLGGVGENHLVIYGIPASLTSFAEGDLSTSPSPKFVSGKTDQGFPIYYGPCTPPGASWHHYTFVLIATDLEPDALPPGLTQEEITAKLKGHTKGSAGIVARFRHP